MRPILCGSDSLRIKGGIYDLYFVTDFIEIYWERILVSDYLYRSFEESARSGSPRDDGHFDFDQTCAACQAMDRLAET